MSKERTTEQLRPLLERLLSIGGQLTIDKVGNMKGWDEGFCSGCDAEVFRLPGTTECACCGQTTTDIPPLDVIFRIWPKAQGGDVIAVFPTLFSDFQGYNHVCYQHVGQHGGCDASHIVQMTKLATPEQYTTLKAELERIGYKLSVVKRMPGYTKLARLRKEHWERIESVGRVVTSLDNLKTAGTV